MKKTLMALLAIFCLADQNVQAIICKLTNAKFQVRYWDQNEGKLVYTQEDDPGLKVYLGISVKCSGTIKALGCSVPDDANSKLDWKKINRKWTEWWQQKGSESVPEIRSIRLICGDKHKDFYPPK